jgi:hypothetical protein
MRNKNKASYTVDAISAGEITKCERAAAALVRAAEEAVAVALGGTSGA